MKRAFKINSVLVLLICFGQLKAQSIFDSRFILYPDFKTDTLFPSKSADHSVKKVVVFEPFVEYRFYKPGAFNSRIFFDSVLGDRLAENKNDYIIYPNKEKVVKRYFSRQLSRKLKRFRDTTLISLKGDTAYFIKKELDSIMLLAKATELKEYNMSDKLINYLSVYHATQCVLLDGVFYETNSNPSQYIKFTLFSFDLYTKKMFFYDTRCQWIHRLMSDHTDERYSRMDLSNISLLKRMLRNYKSYLKPYTKKGLPH